MQRAESYAEFINKTTFVGNGKQGRFQGMIADFAVHGVYAYADLNESEQVYESMIHVASGCKVKMEELRPKPNWVIEDNHNEWSANAKGPRGRHQVISFFEDPDSTESDPKYLIPSPFFASHIPGEMSGTGAPPKSDAIPIQGSMTRPPAKRRQLTRRASHASSCQSEPAGDGQHEP